MFGYFLQIAGQAKMSSLPKENIYGHTKKVKFIINHLNKYMSQNIKPIWVLDFGCGNGIATSQYLIRKEIKYYGVDIHEPSLNYAREHFWNENAAFLNQVPEDILFDIIVYADVLEHLDDPLSVLRQHSNQLKDKGIIIGSVPNGFGPFEIEKKLDSWLGLSKMMLLAATIKRKFKGQGFSEKFQATYNDNCGHIQFFTKNSFFFTLQQSGFQIQSFTNGSFVGAPVSAFLLLRGERIAKLNSKLADFLPYWAVSTWYFTATKR
jgi:SAM-dependent methyltransferase